MYRRFTVPSDEADRVFEHVGRLTIVSGNDNGSDLADPATHQAMLSSPNIFNSSSSVALTRNISSGITMAMGAVPNVTAGNIHIDIKISQYKVNEADLAFLELPSSALSPSEIDNQFDNSTARVFLAPNEGYSAEGGRDEAVTSFIRNHATLEFEEPIELVDHALEPATTPSPAHATLATGALEPRTCIEVPEMLSRFLRVDRKNDPLRYEASIAISEGRVQHGEDIVRRKISEEDWQWNITLLSTAANTSWG